MEKLTLSENEAQPKEDKLDTLISLISNQVTLQQKHYEKTSEERKTRPNTEQPQRNREDSRQRYNSQNKNYNQPRENSQNRGYNQSRGNNQPRENSRQRYPSQDRNNPQQNKYPPSDSKEAKPNQNRGYSQERRQNRSQERRPQS